MLRLAVGLAALCLSACVSVNSTMLADAKPGEAVEASSVKIYRDAGQIPGPYTEIALIHVQADSGFTNEAEMYSAMRGEAARLGATGVLLDGLSWQSAEISGRGIAVRMKESPTDTAAEARP